MGPTYIVKVSGRADEITYKVQEVWELIGKGHIGSLYPVFSPSGHNVPKSILF